MSNMSSFMFSTRPINTSNQSLNVGSSTKMTNLYKAPLHGLRSPWFDGAWKEQIHISFKYLSIMKKINVSELVEAKYYL